MISSLAGEYVNLYRRFFESYLETSIKIKINIIFDPVIPLLGIDPIKIKASVYVNINKMCQQEPGTVIATGSGMAE